MQCLTCGNSLSPASTYCSACGTSVGAPGLSADRAEASQSKRGKTTQSGSGGPPRAQTAYYGRYGPSPNGSSPPTPPDTSSASRAGDDPGAADRQSSASDAPTAPDLLPAPIPPSPPENHAPRRVKHLLGGPLAGRLIALGAALLLIALLAELGTFGYRTYQRNQAEQRATATTNAYRHATATGNAYATETANVVFLNDPLAHNTNGWSETNGATFFQGGQYHLHNTDPNKTLNSYYEGRQFDDFKLQIIVTTYTDANPNADVPYAYGIVLRADPTDPSNKYVFFISPAGTYNFARHDAGSFDNNGWTDLAQTPFGPSGAIHTGKGATNTLTIIAQGNTFTLFINEQQVETITDNTGTPYLSGWIGVMVEGADMEAGFSNLVVTGPNA